MSPLSPTAVAKELGEFTRRQFADAVGVTPLAVGRYLTKLEEDERISRDGRIYRWDPVELRAPDTPRPHHNDDPRILARKLRSFTCDFFASQGGRSKETARKQIKAMLEEGIVRASGDKEWREHGHSAIIYEVVPLPKHKTPRPNHAKVEREKIASEAQRLERVGRHVAGSGQSKKGRHLPKDPKLQDLAKRVVKHGGKVERSGSDHFKVTLPNGVILGMSNTPDRSAWKKVKAEMKRKGFNADTHA